MHLSVGVGEFWTFGGFCEGDVCGLYCTITGSESKSMKTAIQGGCRFGLVSMVV